MTVESTTKGSYDITYTLRYDDTSCGGLRLAAINPDSSGPITVSGIGDISIRNGGSLDPTGGDKRIKLYISEVGSGTA